MVYGICHADDSYTSLVSEHAGCFQFRRILANAGTDHSEFSVHFPVYYVVRICVRSPKGEKVDFIHTDNRSLFKG